MPETTTFNYTGAQQTYVVPSGANEVEIECWGAQGGEGAADEGGKGGHSKGILAVAPGETLYVYVGGAGANSSQNRVAGGWNGGGRGACSGGGASDVRQAGTALADRKIVGGGGGGASGSATARSGGAGGGASGGDGEFAYAGKGGTQTAGGAGGSGGSGIGGGAGSVGIGGDGADSTYDGGGGGGGYYGGGGGQGGGSNVDSYGGGGGSGYLGGVTAGTDTVGVRSGDGLVLITPVNTPPNAPTLTNPVGGASFDRTADQRFTWDFNDPDAGDSQSQYELRYRLVGASTWTTVGPNATTNTFHDFAAGTFAAGDYEWQARTWDAQGEVGPWSASEFFTAATPPDPPSITDPISGQTIPTESYTVEWSTPSQAAYQLRRVADDAGSPDTVTVYSDTGTVESGSARSRSVSFPTNNRWEHVQIRIRNDGLWSEWASVRVEVSYTPPASPSGSTATHSTGAAVDVSGTNPAPAGDEPTVTEMRLHVRSDDDPHRPPEGIRIAVGEPANPTYTDWGVASGVAYEWRWQAIGDNGTSSYSAWFS